MNDPKTKTPFRYAGGKYYALKYILPYISEISHSEYREPFVGGGSIFLGKNKAKINWINDIDPELINTYLIIQDKIQHIELIKMLEHEIATRERHAEMKLFNPQNNLERAFKYFYLNRTSYSGIMKQPAWGYNDEKSSPPKNWGDMIRKVHKKLNGVKITCLDFMQIILEPSNEQVLLYLDPPYFEADQKRAYKNHFLADDHFRLSAALRNCPHKFILSYDNIPQAKDIYGWAHIIELSWNYNTSNLSAQKRKKGQELLITNFPLTSLVTEIDCSQLLLV